MSKIVKGVGKVFRSVGKVVRKVAPIALAAGAVIFTGGAALGASWAAGGLGAAASSAVGALGIQGTMGTVLASTITQAGYGAAIGGLLGGGKGLRQGAMLGAITGAGTGLLNAGSASAGTSAAARNAGGRGLLTQGGNAGMATVPTEAVAQAAPAAAAPSSGLGAWANQNQTIVGQTIAGLGSGLVQGMAAKDAAKSEMARDEANRAFITGNYRSTGRGLLSASYMPEGSYLAPEQRFAPEALSSRPSARGLLNQQPQEQPAANTPQRVRFVYDPSVGRIVQTPV